MASVSYSIAVGQTLEQVTAGTNAPSAGSGTIELRIDQTAAAVTDAAGNRTLKKGEVVEAVIKLLQYLIRDVNVVE
jgi:hypothetical protein